MRFPLQRRNGRSRNVTRICFATDIHGSERCFRKFLNAGKAYSVDHLILGGDITGKVLVPIERRKGRYYAGFNDHAYADLDESERAELEKLIRASGQYPIVGERDELVALEDSHLREDAFRRVVAENIDKWVNLAEDRLRGTGIRCFITPGNDDYPEVDEALQGSEVVEYVEGRCVQLDDQHEMITTGYSNVTPWASPREMDEDSLSTRITAMFEQAKDPSRAIAVLHPPPYGTQLDQAPAIDDEFNIQIGAGGAELTSVGSTAVRGCIERYQPLLGLHGHVHESKGADYLGGTLCLNPGSEYTNGNLLCALLNISDARVNYQFVTG